MKEINGHHLVNQQVYKCAETSLNCKVLVKNLLASALEKSEIILKLKNTVPIIVYSRDFRLTILPDSLLLDIIKDCIVLRYGDTRSDILLICMPQNVWN